MFNDFSGDKIIFYDGAMGTMLQKRGLKPGSKPVLMNMTAPDTVREVHSLYIEAGSDIICTNTFGANKFELEGTGYSQDEVITAAVDVAKQAVASAGANTKIALNIGPLGQFIEPLGDLEPDQAVEAFAQQAIAGQKAGADLVAIETMSELSEMKAAMKAVRENTNLPIFATMTFDVNGYTFMGVPTNAFIELAEVYGVTATGMNCSLEPKVMFPVAKRFAEGSRRPLIIKLNAGLPEGATGRYSVSPEEFAQQMLPYADIGIKIAGGCCGTTPEYIVELRKVLSAKSLST
jgi:5-methyltetrahydrofolate--homocysteine methyltransferase